MKIRRALPELIGALVIVAATTVYITRQKLASTTTAATATAAAVTSPLAISSEKASRIVQLKELGIPSRKVAWSPDGGLLAIVPTEGAVRFVDRKTLADTGATAGDTVADFSWSPEKNGYAYSDASQEISVYDSTKNSTTKIAVAYERARLEYSTEGPHLILMGGTPPNATLWDLLARRQVNGFYSPYGLESSVVGVSPSGNLIALGSQRGGVEIHYARAGYSSSIQSPGVNGLEFSPDGKHLAIACNDGTVRIVAVDTVITTDTLSIRGESVLAVAWSPDGSVLAAAGSRTGLTLWDAERGQLISALDVSDRINWLAFSRDGELLISAGDKGTIVWGLKEALPQSAPAAKTSTEAASGPVEDDSPKEQEAN